MLKVSLYPLFFLLLGCGGASQHEPREVKTLYLKGVITNGIDYECGERKGVTKSSNQSEHGSITCIYAPLKLYLGSLYLGELASIKNAQNIYLQTLVNSFDGNFNNKSLLKKAILLLSLDDKVSNEYISISQETKNKLTLENLDSLSIMQLNQSIKAMGFTPVSQEKAKNYLIMHSENTNIGKPSIQAFKEDISSSLSIGSTIGELSILKGDGTLHYPFKLEGVGSEYFLLNNKSKLILMQSLGTKSDYNLTVTVSNEYGYNSQMVNLKIKEGQKIGKVQLDGLLKNATVKLFKLNSNNSKDFIASTITNQRGSFDLMSEHLDDHEFYSYEVDNNLRLITKGIWIKNSMHKIRITPLSEMLYTYIEKLPFEKLEKNLHKYSKLLLKESLDEQSIINTHDVIIFNPIFNKNLLYPTLLYNNTYNRIRDKIKLKELSYKQDLFSAYIIDSYQANAIEIVGSTVYTIDMMNSGEFRMYDLETKKLIGKLKLSNTPSKKDNHVLYINLLDKDVSVINLSNWSYYIDIKNQRKPLLIEEPFISYYSISGNFSRLTVGTSLAGSLFTKEKKTYFYNFDLNNEEHRKIKVIKSTLNNSELLYLVDSQLSHIESLWTNNYYLYVIGDNKINIFKEKEKNMELVSSHSALNIKGNILGIEENLLYILYQKTVTILDITLPLEPKFIENISVSFEYKLGIKTNGKYLTTGSNIIDIQALRASKTAK